MDDLLTALNDAVTRGDLLPSSRDNAVGLLRGSPSEVEVASVRELVEAGQWTELNDRFFKQISFGTSGLRGRTIGRVVTAAERGTQREDGRPEFPTTGTSTMNYSVAERATRGFVAYLKAELAAAGATRRPRIVFAHDTRHFSRDFAERCARTVVAHGGEAFLFESHRPTPELSFAIRHLEADGGVMHTASHNPAHDNGYKVYFSDGAGIIDPGATRLSQTIASQPPSAPALPHDPQGTLTLIGPEVDAAYTARLKDVILQPDLLRAAKSLKVVFTAIHGTGGVHVPALLRSLGVQLFTVPEQDVPDGRFPTVDSPNPENAAALKMACDLAESVGADLVIGTDPDCDRMGVAVRDQSGKLILLSGNQTGALMAWYRVTTHFQLGLLNEANKSHAVLVKTFVTSGLQEEIARRHGLPVTNTLTGFKWIGGKQLKYERLLPPDVQARYRSLSVAEAREAHLQHGRYYVFGGEESYGYLGADFVRDKDGNMAVLMFVELAALAASQGRTVAALLDDVWSEYGYFAEISRDLKLEGAQGAAQITKLVESYATHPPKSLDGSPVLSLRHFGKEEIRDEEGDLVPHEALLFVDLADGRRFAVRPSGTEPKVKFYFFGKRLPADGARMSPPELASAKSEVPAALQRLWDTMQPDIQARLA
ncbi:MAG: phospho-sugar mutase [Verrucomicrobiales bacterium]